MAECFTRDNAFPYRCKNPVDINNEALPGSFPIGTVKFVMQQQRRKQKLGLAAVHHKVAMFIYIALRIRTALRFDTAKTIAMIDCM